MSDIEAQEEIGGVANGWRPIETAPKDGTEIIFWDRGDYGICWWDEAEGVWLSSYCEETPTHWMPLPAFPITQTQEKEA